MLRNLFLSILLASTMPLAAQQYIISTFAGRAAIPTPVAATSANLPPPVGIVFDTARGNLYFSAGHAVYMVDSTQTIKRVAGTGLPGFSGDGGQALVATMNSPTGLAVDGAGNLFIADTANYRVRRISTAGVITTVAGGGQVTFVSGFRADPTLPAIATAVGLVLPNGVAVDSAGAILYIADSDELLKVNLSTKNMTRIAVSETCCLFFDYLSSHSATTMAVDTAGNLYFGEDYFIWKVPPTGTPILLAGTGEYGSTGDGGPASAATFSAPYGVVADAAGNIYILDQDRVRKVGANATISAVANSSILGPAEATVGIAIDSTGNLYFSGAVNTITNLTQTGTRSTYAGGSSLNTFAATSGLGAMKALTVDAGGNVFLAGDGFIRKVTTSGLMSTLAGGGTAASAIDANVLAADGSGNLYFGEFLNTFTQVFNSRVRKVGAAGGITTVAGNGNNVTSGDGGAAIAAGVPNPTGLALDTSGNVYVTADTRIRKVTPQGIISTFAGGGTQQPGYTGPATNANLVRAAGLSRDASGNLYVAITSNIDKVTAAGTISTLSFSDANGPTPVGSVGASFASIGGGLTMAGPNNVIMKSEANGVIRAIAGKPAFFLTDATPQTEVGIATNYYLEGRPLALAADPAGRILYAESTSNTVRALTPVGGAAVLTSRSVQSAAISVGQSGAIFTIAIANAAQAGPTSGTVSVTEILTGGVTLVSMTGTGWACSGTTCTRPDAMAGGASYPSITVTVNVSATAGSQFTSQATVSGGGALFSVSTDLFQLGASGSNPPATPVLTSPVNSATGVSVAPQLTWNAASGATSYDVYFGTAANPPLVTNTTGLTYAATALTNGTAYSWKIVAKNTAGSTASSTNTFTTVAAIGPCTSATVTPNTPFTDNTAQTVSLTLTASPANCTWTATSDSPWATVPSSGAGSGIVTAVVEFNGTNAQRGAVLTVAGQSIAVTQRRTATVFGDANPADFFFDALGLMRSKNITAGCSATPLLYCPGNNVTRGQMAIFIVRAVTGGDTFTYTTTPYFGDVPATHGFFKWIQKMRDLGVTAGCGNGNYCPDDAVTRGQMGVFIIRARMGSTTLFNSPPAPYFTDVAAAHPYFTWIQKMRQVGITAGCSATTYCPDDPVSRGQMAIFIERGAFNELLAAGTTTIGTVSPNVGSRGGSFTVTIMGVGTTFAQGTTQVTVGGAGVTVSAVTVTSTTTVSALLTIAAGADPSPRSIIVTTGTQEAVGPNLFVVQ